MWIKFEELSEHIAANDRESVIRLLEEIIVSIKEGDVSLVEYIASPANLTKLHRDLCEKMGAVRKIIELRDRVPNAAHRAAMLVQAMITAVRASHDNQMV